MKKISVLQTHSTIVLVFCQSLGSKSDGIKIHHRTSLASLGLQRLRLNASHDEEPVLDANLWVWRAFIKYITHKHIPICFLVSAVERRHVPGCARMVGLEQFDSSVGGSFK